MFAVAIFLVVSMALQGESAGDPASDARYEMTEVNSTDIAALKVWASDWCRDAVVEDLASALGLTNSKAAVVDYLAKGLTGEARRAVIEVCEQELIETPEESSK